MYTRVSSKELLVPPELETANCSRAVEWTEGVHAHHGILHSSERKEVTTACGPWLHDSLLLRLQDQQSARLMTVCFLMTTVTHPNICTSLKKMSWTLIGYVVYWRRWELTPKRLGERKSVWGTTRLLLPVPHPAQTGQARQLDMEPERCWNVSFLERFTQQRGEGRHTEDSARDLGTKCEPLNTARLLSHSLLKAQARQPTGNTYAVNCH